MVHRLLNSGDVSQPIEGQMTTFLHYVDDGRELLEVFSLCGAELMLPEERDYPFNQICPSAHHVPQEILPMVVMAPIQIDPSAFEEINEIVQDLSTGSSLDYGESRLNLPAKGHTWALDNRGAEAPVSVDEPNDPSNVLESFLLIFRRGALYATRHRIVTAHIPSVPRGSDKK